MRKSWIAPLVLAGALFAPLVLPLPAEAGNGPFFVLYDHLTHEPGEMELMPMFDIATEPDGETFLTYMIELDLGLAERWQLDLMTEGHLLMDRESADGAEEFRSTGFRIESRYRLFDSVPLNPMVYVEYEDLDIRTRYQMEVSGRHLPDGEEEEVHVGRPREQVLETRLILSEEVGPARISLNWINESGLGDGVTAFGYAFGASIPVMDSRHSGHGERQEHSGHSKTRVGVECYGAFGDTEDFGPDPDTREHYLSVNVMRHFGKGWMFKAAGSVGLTSVSRDLFRIGIGYEF